MIPSARAISYLALLLATAFGCTPRDQPRDDPWARITFDLSQLDDDGLRGPPNGRRTLAYEFRIPNTPRHKAKVSAIDPTVQCTSGARGRIGCGEDQCLCIGFTHQQGLKTVLRRLAELDYIERIDEAFHE